VGEEGHRHLSVAGWWFALVSQPIYVFFVFRFVYRLGLWWRFLWLTSRLDLELNAAHPDEAGGLAFLGLALPPFAVPTFAIASAVAGALADMVLWGGASVVSAKYLIIALAVILTGAFVGPLFFFVGGLARVKRQGMLHYGTLSERQLREFEEKWLSGRTKKSTLEVPDFSAVIDLSSTTAATHHMKPRPFDRAQIVPIILAALLPFLPVLALQMPIKEIIMQLAKLAL